MRKGIMILLIIFGVLSTMWAQSVITAFDRDTLFCAGLSATRGGFGLSAVDSYVVIDSTIINYFTRVLTYGGGLFGGGGTTIPAFFLDGNIYSANPYPPTGVDTVSPQNTEYSEIENILIADWWLADSTVQFTQTIYPFSVDSQGAAIIRYSIINHDTVSHQVGAMLFLDTNIDGVDDAPFVYPGIEVESTLVMDEEDIPPYFQVYEIGPWVPDDSQTVARIILDGLPNIKPQRLAICDQRTGLGTVAWDLDVLPAEPISDGMIIIQWGPENIEPGEGITYATTYGLAPEGEFIGGPLGGRVEMPYSTRIFHCELIPNPFSASVLFRNNTDSTMYNIYTKLETHHTGVSIDPDTMMFLADSMLSSEIVPINWTVSLDSLPVTDTSLVCTLWAWAETVITDGVLDTIHTIIPREITVPGATYQGPTAEIIYPLDNTFTSNVFQPLCIYLTDDDTTVAELSIRLGFIDPTTGEPLPWEIRPGLGGCTYENDTLYFPHEVYRSDGERVIYYLRPTYDMRGCPLDPTVSARYVVDLSPPELGYSYWYPPDDSVMEDSLLIAWINVIDRINRIDTLSLSVTIEEDESTHTHWFTDTTRDYYDSLLSYDFDTSFLYIDPLSEGWRFPDGPVTITLDSVCDLPDYGDPNCATFTPQSWSFIVNAHGPRAYPRTPDDGWFVSILSPDITFYLYDGNGIDPTSVLYEVDGDTFPAPEDYDWHDSIIVHTPDVSWDDGYEVEVEVLSAIDSFGKILDTTSNYFWSFTIDTSIPTGEMIVPAEGETISTPAPMVKLYLHDEYAGVADTSIVLTIDGVEWTVDGSTLIYDAVGETLTWDGAAVGASLAGSVEVCVYCFDKINMGEPNEMNYCSWFYVNRESPLVIFDPDFYSICTDDAPLSVIISDEDGVEGSSIAITIGDDTLDLDEPELSYDGGSEILTFTPTSSYWGMDGDSVEFCVISAADIYWNSISSPVCRTFIVDLYPPEVGPIDIIAYTHSDYPGILDSTDFWFYYTNEVGTIDSASVTVEIYLDDVLEGSFNLLDYPEILWIEGDSVVIFAPGAEFTFEEDNTYTICLTLEDQCYAGYHEETTTCTLYYATEIQDKPITPHRTTILPNYPDPFNASTIIPVHLGKMSYAELQIFDVQGRLIKTLWNDVLPQGITNFRWDGTNSDGKIMSSGVYFVRLRTPTATMITRMSLIK
ncbi:hypothetical protein DRQ33_00625 [bacterium]|nr:MAG: hypothetical protein DRQ33_00625 [bacterium]